MPPTCISKENPDSEEKASLDDEGTLQSQDELTADPEEKTRGDIIEDDDYPDGGLRAWLVVFGGALGNATTFGFVNAWGEFQSYYEKTLLSDTSPSTIAWIGSIQYAFTFVPGLVLGQLFDRGHLRIPLAIASITLVLCTLLVAECKVYWQFLLCQGIALGLASGSIFAPLIALVAHWFNRRKGLALSVLALGSSAGGTLFPIVVHNLIKTVGFQWTMRIVALILMCLLVGTNFTVARRLPPRPTSGPIVDLREFKSLPYTVYCLATLTAFLGLYTMLTYINVSAELAGVDVNFAEYLDSIGNAGTAVGRIFSGCLVDRYGPINVMAPSALLAGTTTFIWPFVRTQPSFTALTFLNGICNGAYGSIISQPVISMGATQTVGLRVGMFFTTLALGAVAGPPISGAINTATGDYKGVGIYAGSCLFASVILMLLSRHLILKGRIRGKA